MNRRFFQLLPLCAIFTLAKGDTAAIAEQKLPDIPAFIVEHKSNRDIILSSPEYDRNAKVYFLYGVSDLNDNMSLKQKIRHLGPAVHKIKRNGAELIVHLHFSEETIDNMNKNNRYGSLERQINNCSISCILVNSYKEPAANILFRDSGAYDISGSTDNLLALDAYGNLLATYHIDQGSVMLTRANTGRETKIRGIRDINLWAGDAITNTYKKLVADIEDVEFKTKKKQEKVEQKRRKAEELEQLKAAQRRKDEQQKVKIPRWKRVKVGS